MTTTEPHSGPRTLPTPLDDDEATDTAPQADKPPTGPPDAPTATTIAEPANRVIVAVSRYGSAAFWHGTALSSKSQYLAQLRNDREAAWADFVDALEAMKPDT